MDQTFIIILAIMFAAHSVNCFHKILNVNKYNNFMKNRYTSSLLEIK